MFFVYYILTFGSSQSALRSVFHLDMPIHCASLVSIFVHTNPFKPRPVRLYHLQIRISLSNQIIDKIDKIR